MSRFRKPTDISRNQRDLQTDTADRLEAIVEAAERAAEGVIDDAEAQARQYLAQAHSEADRLNVGRTEELSELVASLLGQAISLREEAERLQVTLEAASARIGASAAAEPPAPAPPEQQSEPPRLRAVDTGQAPAVEAEVQRANAAGARLLATQMAVSGSSREEIAERLETDSRSRTPMRSSTRFSDRRAKREMHEDPTRLMGPEDRGPGGQGPHGGRPHGNMRLLVAGLIAVIVGLLIAVIVIAGNDDSSDTSTTSSIESSTEPSTTTESSTTTTTESTTTEEEEPTSKKTKKHRKKNSKECRRPEKKAAQAASKRPEGV